MIWRIYRMELDKEKKKKSDEKHRTIMKLDILKNIEIFQTQKGQAPQGDQSIQMSFEEPATKLQTKLTKAEQQAAEQHKNKSKEDSKVATEIVEEEKEEKSEFAKKND